MNRTALIVCAALASASTAPVFAGETAAAARPSTARIMVSVCERDALTQAAFRSQHGPSPVYVTADQVLSARASGERWSEARCISASEHQRLTRQLSPRVSARSALRSTL